MFLADQWQDYEVLDCGGGEKLERWGDVYLRRPDPQAIWPARDPSLWRKAQAHYHRSEKGGGSWEFFTKLPDRWVMNYKNLRFYVRPTGFKHTGLFPEQAVNWDFAMDKIRKADRPIRVLNLFAYIGISVPPFWFGIMLIILFALVLGVLPSSGMRTIGVNDPVDVARHAILPVIVLSVGNTATFVRYLRAGVISQMREEYVTVAVAQGPPRRRVLTHHVLRNSILPLITMVGMNFGTLVTGSFIVESVFGWPGLGVLCMDAVNNRDYTMIMGITMLASYLLLIGNLLADVLYAVVDPRIRLDGGSDE